MTVSTAVLSAKVTETDSQQQESDVVMTAITLPPKTKWKKVATSKSETKEKKHKSWKLFKVLLKLETVGDPSLKQLA